MSRRQEIKTRLHVLKKQQPATTETTQEINELEAELILHTPQGKPRVYKDTDQSAADDYLDYLSDQW